MAHIALYRAFRPQTFDDVVAQKHIVYPLQQSVKNGTVNHALLFSGTRGTGKTSLAKIYAKAINCENPQEGNPCNACAVCKGANDGSLLDIIEMDAASNNSVDTIRKMTDEVIYTPVMARYKVYIIDEAHMLTTGAFNALLKTLEEPPAHAVFILATTEAHRIPATIASRCQRYDFRRIGLDDIEAQLRRIATDENIDIATDALKTIAGLADGALRDAISLLDQVQGGVAGTITRQHVLDLVGLASDQTILELLTAIVEQDPVKILDTVEQLAMAGADLARLTLDMGQHFRNLLILKYAGDAASVVHLPDDVQITLKQLGKQIDGATLMQIIQKLSELLSDLRFSAQPRTTLDIGLLALLSTRTLEAAAPAAAPIPKPVPVAAPQQAPPPTQPEPPVDMAPSSQDEPVDEAPAALTPEIVQEEGAPVETKTLNHLDLIEKWDQVLTALSEEHNRMDLRLMAKSAAVSLDDRVMTLRFKASMKGAYLLVSKRESVELITQLVVKLLAQPVSVSVQLGDEGGQISAEDAWVTGLRERTFGDE